MPPPAKRAASLLDALAQGPLLFDGAMGTMLHQAGVSLEACFDALNTTEPQRVLAIHRAYLRAGAQVLETNTFGANSYKLGTLGRQGAVSELNRAGVALARRAIELERRPAWVVGSVGPLGVRLAPYGRVPAAQARRAYQEQIGALLGAGVDGILIETQVDLQEALLALEAARLAGAPLVMASMTFTADDRTLLGDTPETVARQLAAAGAHVVGANCSGGPAQLLRILERMRRAAPQARLFAQPNAGWPAQHQGRILYPANADYFAALGRALVEAGACAVGGCCGTTPEHIAALGAALAGAPLLSSLAPSAQAIQPAGAHVEPAMPPTRLASLLSAGRFVLSVEMEPPRGPAAHRLLAAAETLLQAGADVINLSDSPMARMRMSPWGACQRLHAELGAETVLNFPTRGRNLLRLQGDLLAAHALGLRNLFVVMGDPTAIGDYPEAMDDFDLAPSGLIRLIKRRFNRGCDSAGEPIGEPTAFFVGCALNLGAQDLEREVRLLRRKIRAGADFAITQPIFESRPLRRFRQRYQERYGPLTLPLLVGALPLASARHAEYLHNEVPGINIPQPLRAQLAKAGKQAPQVGMDLCLQLLQELQGQVQGAYLIPAFGRFDRLAALIENLRVHLGARPLPARPAGTEC